MREPGISLGCQRALLLDGAIQGFNEMLKISQMR